ncbi:MAG: insulinase family protein [Firmicutes bacterium]|nr:insulinase family protein [Bacillota bacterium]
MIKSKILDDGVRLVTEQTSFVQSVAIGIWVKAGAMDETPDISGISHLIEHMMFKGTEKRTARDIAADVDRIGGQINAFTGKEATCYYIKTISSNSDKAAEILLDMLLGSKFDSGEMKKEKKVICEEIKMVQDMPDEDVQDTMLEMVFKGDPLAKSIIGTATSLRGISRNKVMKYLHDEYTRSSIVIAVAGNFDEDEITALFENKFRELKKNKPAKRHKRSSFEPAFKVKVRDIEQSHICLAIPALKQLDPRYYALSLLNNIMGGSMSSRLFQNIREEKGLAYSVFSTTAGYTDNGYFSIYAGVAHDKIRAAIEGIKEEMRLLEEKGITEEELATAKAQVKSSYVFAQENISGRMFSIGKNMTMFGKIITLEEIVEGYDRVNMDDIDNVKHLITDLSGYCGVCATAKRIPLRKYVTE